MPSGEGRMKIAAILLEFVLFFAFLGSIVIPAEAHVVGHVKTAAKYVIQFAYVPAPPIPHENVSLIFSVQDRDFNNLRNVTARLYLFGDFQLSYVFPADGTYAVIIEIFEHSENVTVGFLVAVSRLDRPMQDYLPLLMMGITAFVLGFIIKQWLKDRRRDKRMAHKTPLSRKVRRANTNPISRTIRL